ncbi:uncharacterized protein isoform X2 [Choristoneura fumiferana]
MFESQYYRLVASARNLLPAGADKDGSPGSPSRSGSVASYDNDKSGGTCEHTKRFNLPKINIPIFNGSYQHWLEFRDIFTSMIHSNRELDNISKFHYLRASLQGNAAMIVKNIDFTNNNYTIAWNLLCDRYNNSRLLVNNHVQALFNVESVSKESSRSLRYLIDVTNKNIRALTTLNQPTEHWDTLIIHMMSTKLDPITNLKWEEHRNTGSDAPTLADFCTFLRNRADLLETLEENKAKNSKFDHPKSKSFIVVSDSQKSQQNNFSSGKYSKTNKCPLCKDEHTLYNCNAFRDLSIEDRVVKAKQFNVCLNCLRTGHSQNKCQSPHCRYCRYKHNTLLHLEKRDSSSNDYNSVPIQENVALPVDNQTYYEPPTDNVTLSTNITQQTTAPQILLSTAMVKVYDSNGNKHTARLLLDNGSTANFISHELCGKLGLSRRSTRSTISGICNQSSKSTQLCNLTLYSLYSDYKVNLDCLVLDEITKSLPSKLIKVNDIPIPTGLQLADPSFYVPSGVDILVGAEIFWSVICNNSIDLGKKQPKLYETKLGWLVSGYVSHASTTNSSNQHHCHFIKENENINQFWELDTIPTRHSFTAEERACEESFQANTYRNSKGRFVVTIPLKKDPSELGDSYAMAKMRFLSLERRFNRDPVFKEKYTDFMQEYEQLGHMTLNSTSPPLSNTCGNNNNVSCFIPHHGVLRESSTTTKLRAVFDGSAVTTSGVSLNNLQMVGPTVQDDLLSILIRFRQHKFVVSGDIEKMYRAIEVNPVQRPLQQIIFRSDQYAPLKTYTLNTLTYGTASAPYLAIKCLTSLADVTNNEKVKNAIKRDFYVDDYLGGGTSKEEVIQTCKELISILASAQFNLRKFQSNNLDILKVITDGKQEINNILQLSDSAPNMSAKTLGLHWLCDSDTLSFSINIDLREKITKRHVLSVISQIFDPLGLVGPVIVEAKMIMQSLWKLKSGWDDEVPTNIKTQWASFASKLSYLNDIKIPRWVLQNDYIKIEIHTFCDSSEKAYGACVYARTISQSGNIHVQLIASKNKIAPIKPTTIPRLELCGALLGAKLTAKILNSMTLQVDCRYWCDSTIVLGWLSTPVHRLKPFVRNRVNEIHETTANGLWSYVPSLDNPADLVSRGVKADLISSSPLWWSGPPYLLSNDKEWPKMPNEKRDLPDIVCHLAQSSNTSSTSTNILLTLIHKHSNLSRLFHVVTYIKRFISNCRNKQSRYRGFLTADEIRESQNTVIKLCQGEMFPEEYRILKLQRKLPAKNRLLNLTPFLDSNDIIRVGGRLDNSPYSYDQKHPALLCSKHHLTKIIFETQHIKLLHEGPQGLLANIRQQYYPLGGRNLAKLTVRKCIPCIRQKGKTVQPIMGQLPESRTKLEFPFLHCSVDYAGPVLIADKKGRGSKLLKSYLCIFVCFAVKAVHLELVTDLTKEAYIAALQRFISRRGKPLTITSDHGTNFVGACNELTSVINKSNLASDLADEGIKFLFTPAYSPHFNGLAESAVRSTKFHLKRILNLTHLTYEEMSTCLTQIEAILNSRPLTPLSTDPTDMSALTPAHFLIGRSLTSVPCPQIADDVNINLLQRHKRIDVIKQHFWRRFANDYVFTLQQKSKWLTSSSPSLKVDSLVLVKDKVNPPLMWCLGRVTRLYPGPDGINRVADVKTRRGTLRRGWNNLCPLPMDQDL